MALRRRRPLSAIGARAVGDEGFTLVETLVSLGLLAIIMTAATTFFVNVLQSQNYLRGKQVAVQLAADAMEQARTFERTSLVSGRDKASSDAQWADGTADPTTAPYLNATQEAWDAGAATGAGLSCSVTSTTPCISTKLPSTAGAPDQVINGVTFSVNTYLGTCIRSAGSNDCVKGALSTITHASDVGFYRVVVAIRWPGRSCPAGACSYVTAELQNATADDPIFNLNSGSPVTSQTNAALSLTSPGAQTTTTGVYAILPMLYSGGTGAVAWSAGALPAGLSIDPVTGVLSGVPTCAAGSSCAVTITGVDSLGTSSSVSFTWAVNPVATISSPVAGSTQVSALGVTITNLPLTVGSGTGTGPFSWSVTGLPAGLSVSGTNIVGKPTALDDPAVGPSTVTVAVTDNAGKKTTETLSWSVISPPVITPVTTTQWTYVNKALAVPITVTGGSGTYTWASSVAWGSVSGSGSSAVFTGTPTTASNSAYSVKLTVTDTASNATATMTFPLRAVVTGAIAEVVDLPGQCVDVSSNSSTSGAKVQNYSCSTTGAANQTWTIGSDGGIRATVGSTPVTRCLTAASATVGALVTSNTCASPVSALQTWDIAGVTNGQQISLRGSAAPALCLDVSGTATGNGAALDLVDCSDSTRAGRDTWMAR